MPINCTAHYQIELMSLVWVFFTMDNIKKFEKEAN